MSPDPPDGKRRTTVQFGLGSLVWLTVVAAVYLAAQVASVDWASELIGRLVLIACPLVLTVTVIHARGTLQTFCIGALFPAVLGFLAEPMYVRSPPETVTEWMDHMDYVNPESAVPDEYRMLDMINMAIHLSAMPAFGLLAVWVRSRVEPGSSICRRRAPEARQAGPDDPFA